MSSKRVVAITGASAGIGRATALRFARAGDALAICARRVDKLQAVADEIRAGGGEVLAVPADVTKLADMERFVSATVERFGTLDVMMCNAGFGVAGAIDEITPDQMRELMDVNYIGTYYAARAALPIFRRKGSRSHRDRLVRSSASAACRTWARMRRRNSRRSDSPNACAPSSRELGIHVTVVYPVSTETEFFEVMSRATGTRVPRRRARGRTRRSWRMRSLEPIERPVPEVLPALQVPRARLAERDCARFLRSPREAVRPQASLAIRRSSARR